MIDRRRFFKTLAFLSPLAVLAPHEEISLKSGPRMMGMPMCECGCVMFTTSARRGGNPIEAMCTNRYCEYFEKRYKLSGVSMEPVE